MDLRPLTSGEQEEKNSAFVSCFAFVSIFLAGAMVTSLIGHFFGPGYGLMFAVIAFFILFIMV